MNCDYAIVNSETGNVTDNVSKKKTRHKKKRRRNMKKLTKVAVSAAIMASAFAMSASADGGKVYYLNFAPEVADQWEALAEKY